MAYQYFTLGVVVWDLIIAGNGALAGLVAITGALWGTGWVVCKPPALLPCHRSTCHSPEPPVQPPQHPSLRPTALLPLQAPALLCSRGLPSSSAPLAASSTSLPPRSTCTCSRWVPAQRSTARRCMA